MYTLVAASGMTGDSSQVMPGAALIIESYQDETVRAYYND